MHDSYYIAESMKATCPDFKVENWLHKVSSGHLEEREGGGGVLYS